MSRHWGRDRGSRLRGLEGSFESSLDTIVSKQLEPHHRRNMMKRKKSIQREWQQTTTNDAFCKSGQSNINRATYAPHTGRYDPVWLRPTEIAIGVGSKKLRAIAMTAGILMVRVHIRIRSYLRSPVDRTSLTGESYFYESFDVLLCRSPTVDSWVSPRFCIVPLIELALICTYAKLCMPGETVKTQDQNPRSPRVRWQG